MTGLVLLKTIPLSNFLIILNTYIKSLKNYLNYTINELCRYVSLTVLVRTCKINETPDNLNVEINSIVCTCSKTLIVLVLIIAKY